MLRLLALASFLCAHLAGQPADPWKGLRFLVGNWTGAGGGGSAGQGVGSYSFLPELGGRILVRRNVADYPAANGKPAVHHEDVMTVYQESAAQTPQAIYFDSEGHVIHYNVEVDAAAGMVRFLSPVQPGQPRYRLTYRTAGKDVVAGQFEVAPPDRPAEFVKYMEWTARRRL